MFITKKRHDIINQYKDQIKTLEKELQEAKNLSNILEKLADKTETFTVKGANWITTADAMKSVYADPNIPRYVDDILGGKVIEQEGTKCIVIEQSGKVKTGLTKDKADKDYTYKLIRK